MARLGARVWVVGRSPQKTADAAREIGAAGQLVADLSQMSEVRRLAAEFRDRGERLDVLVNNAGAFAAGVRPRAGGDGGFGGPCAGAAALGRPGVPPPLPGVGRVRAEQARQRAVRPRTRPPRTGAAE
ncbi:SDR family NAD(P)-dependent oxidoreductase [Deinococcus sp. DB0503]|uniref:SDR family NAD(P)-dependent oxidoreductase n=1 Tax=Deinococcus sp. DB0503 TaxID=2479203 RepID=UPI00351C16B4